MNCQKCGGKMVREKFYHEGDDFWGFRCVYCSEIIDEVILQNRKNFPDNKRIYESNQRRIASLKNSWMEKRNKEITARTLLMTDLIPNGVIQTGLSPLAPRAYWKRHRKASLSPLQESVERMDLDKGKLIQAPADHGRAAERIRRDNRMGWGG
jgi:hypothetical protein